MPWSAHLGNLLVDRHLVQLAWGNRLPGAVLLPELQLHEVARYGGEHHLAGLPSQGVGEQEGSIVLRAAGHLCVVRVGAWEDRVLHLVYRVACTRF